MFFKAKQVSKLPADELTGDNAESEEIVLVGDIKKS